jgi:hypothetical protein
MALHGVCGVSGVCLCQDARGVNSVDTPTIKSVYMYIPCVEWRIWGLRNFRCVAPPLYCICMRVQTGMFCQTVPNTYIVREIYNKSSTYTICLPIRRRNQTDTSAIKQIPTATLLHSVLLQTYQILQNNILTFPDVPSDEVCHIRHVFFGLVSGWGTTDGQ